MISITVNEEGTLKVVITFTDEEGTEHSLASLTSVNWQLSDVDGNIINGNTFANGLITENPVILTGDDLATGENGSCRIFAVKIIYNSTNGSGLNATEEMTFSIDDLVNI